MRLLSHPFLAWLLALGVLGVQRPGGVQAQSPAPPDSVTVAIEPTYNKVSGVHRLLLGQAYRSLWAAPVRLRVLRLARERGGLTVLERGGGKQTKVLRLRDAHGQQWVLRTIQKYPELDLAPTLRATIAQDILRDQVSAAHPYAALVVPPLAEALGLAHAHPEVVYVPDDPALGAYRAEFANQVFLLEEYEPPGPATDNTAQAQRRLRADPTTRVDQAAVLRARLLDMLLGDYDRHEDQWRWQRVATDKGTLYEPVPRDRDQVFYKPTGWFPHLLAPVQHKASLQGFQTRLRAVSRWNYQARNLDRYFLNELSAADWQAQVAAVQQALPDSVLARAVARLPRPIYQLSGPQLLRTLVARRAELAAVAGRYYHFLAKTVQLPTSDAPERLAVAHEAGGRVRVTATAPGPAGPAVRYQRTFDPADTREVRLFGQGGADAFVVMGAAPSPIRLRLVGGAGTDTFAVAAPAGPRRRLLLYDQASEANQLPAWGLARRCLAADTAASRFNPLGFQYDFVRPLLVLLGYSRDYGVQLISSTVYQKQGFGRAPYAARHGLLFSYGFGNNSQALTYTGDFRRAVGRHDLLVSLDSRGPNYRHNFFGTGNESTFANTGEQRIDYYRNIYDLVLADVRLSHTYARWRLSGGALGQFYTSSTAKNADRYLRIYNDQHPAEDVFGGRFYAGLVASATLDTRDRRSLVARRGVLWTTTLSGLQQLGGYRQAFGQLLSEFAFYARLGLDSTLVLANRTGGGTTLGRANYFQQLRLGGPQNLRGFYLGRFTGQSLAYNNLELRLKLLDFTSYLLPGTLGLVAFQDVGRVWAPGEASARWHLGYGGGLYLVPARLVLVQAVLGFSNEGAYPYLSVGFRF